MIDCLLIGFNEWSYPDYVKMVRSLGRGRPVHRDLNLNYLEVDGQILRSMDLLNRYWAEGRTDPHRRFHNADFLWPVILYLRTYLARRGYRVEYVNLYQDDKDKLREILLSEEVRTVAITTTLYFLPYPVAEIVSFIRRYDERTTIVVGGPHILNTVETADEETVQRNLDFMGGDYYVVNSEGEETLAALLEALAHGASPAAIPNLAYREGDRFVLTPATVERNPLADNPVDYGAFAPAEFGRFVSLRTAKSCPFACSFCNFPEIAGKYTYLSVAQVEEELDRIRDIGGVDTLTFIDDTFNVPKKRFKELLRMMVANRYGFRWNSFYRCDHGDEETIDLMAEAGCEGVFLGMESGSDTILKAMNKTARREHYAKAIPRLRAAGIVTNASLVVGFPGETEETVEETMDFIAELGPDFFGANPWYCHPSTRVWREREEHRLTGSGLDWRHRTMDAETALDHVERMFLEMEGSTWLPEDGFELWSVFYLQRRGLSLEQVKAFARGFNGVVREKLRREGGPGYREALAELQRWCRSAAVAAEGDGDGEAADATAPAPQPRPAAGSPAPPAGAAPLGGVGARAERQNLAVAARRPRPAAWGLERE